MTSLRQISQLFQVRGVFAHGQPHGNGHINDTFAVICDGPHGPVRYILQRINNRVFRDVPALMDNIRRVTDHAAARVASQPRDGRRTLCLVPTRTGEAFLQDGEGRFWRCYEFVENATTHDVIRNPHQAQEAAYAFGHFQGLLADLPPPRLHETIPDFHDTRRRLEALLLSHRLDVCGRAGAVVREVEFVLQRERLVGQLLALRDEGSVPERITHNDTKLNNVMLDDVTGRGICVIDLDTVMPGLALYDFGDMVRSAANSAPEDEPEVARVELSLPVFEAVVKGYLGSAREFLNAAEVANLVLSAQVITFEIGIRFLTDYLDGDIYFKTRRPDHNLHRCRSQFALLRSMEGLQATMERFVRQCLR